MLSFFKRLRQDEDFMTLNDWEKRLQALQHEARSERQRLLTLDPGFAPDEECLHKLLDLNNRILKAWDKAHDF